MDRKAFFIFISMLTLFICCTNKNQVTIKLPENFSGWIFIIGNSEGPNSPKLIGGNVYSISKKKFDALSSVDFYRGKEKVDKKIIKYTIRGFYGGESKPGYVISTDDMIEVLSFYICNSTETQLADDYWLNIENNRRYSLESRNKIDSLISVGVIKKVGSNK
jgi:hypothetical protein